MNKLLLVGVLFLGAFFFVQPTPVLHAADNGQISNTATDNGTVTGSNTAQTIANPLKVASLNDLLAIILKAVVQLGAVILTIALVWTGFKFVAARGNPEKIQSARTALFWTLLGGLILLGATAIQTVIQSTVSAL